MVRVLKWIGSEEEGILIPYEEFANIEKAKKYILKEIFNLHDVYYSFYIEYEGRKFFVINSEIVRLLNKDKIEEYINIIIEEILFPEIV